MRKIFILLDLKTIAFSPDLHMHLESHQAILFKYYIYDKKQLLYISTETTKSENKKTQNLTKNKQAAPMLLITMS